MCIKKFAGAVILSALVLFGCGDDDDGNTTQTYTVTVNGGGVGAFGGGSYSPGATVTIFAGTAPVNHVFENWTSTSVGVFFEDASSRTTIFTMPANAVTVTANFVSDDPNNPSGTCTVGGVCTNNVLQSECGEDFEVGATCQAGGNDDGGNNGGGGDIGSHGSRLIGDWTPTYNIGNVNTIDFLVFKSNGDFCWIDYHKVDNFWVGMEGCNATWRADENYYYLLTRDGYEERMEYSVSGNTLTIGTCYNDDCEILTKGSRPTGTIRSGDPALNGNWRMGGSSLEFSNTYMYLQPNSLYFDNNNCYECLWYTNGNSLFMLGIAEVPNSCRQIYDEYDDEYYEDDCAWTVAETVEFTYTHVPGVSLRLRNTSRGIDDLWEYQSWDKRLNQTESDTRQNLFRNSQSRRALSER